MKKVFFRLLITNWPRKLVAFISAIIIWFIVNQSITITKTFPDVHVRITHLPQDKTVIGLLPTGFLNKKIAVTVTGTKSLLNSLNSHDIEIVIPADGKQESWIAHIDKRNLVNTNGEWDFKKQITDVSAHDLFIHLTKLVTEEVPITILNPIGDPPQGYQFLDVWPKFLIQKVSGPQEEVQAIKEKGLEVVFNLNKISKEDLDVLKNLQHSKQDEISFMVPNDWKEVAIPFQDNVLVPINDPRAEFLRMDFLKQELLPLGDRLPIALFFPLKYSKTLNPETYTLALGPLVEQKNGLKLLNLPLYVKDVSRLFLEVVKDHMQLSIIGAPKSVQEELNWSITFIDLQKMEETYIAQSLKFLGHEEESKQMKEDHFRARFQNYLEELVLYLEDERPLSLKALLEADTITLQLKQVPHES